MISAVILARNTAHLIARAITSVRRFDEVLVYDTMSADRTAEVAKMFGCKVIEKNFEVGFATMKNRAIAEAMAKDIAEARAKAEAEARAKARKVTKAPKQERVAVTA